MSLTEVEDIFTKIFPPFLLNDIELSNKFAIICSILFSIPLIKYLIQRLQTCEKIRHIIVCTTDSPSDEKLVQFLKQEN